MIADNCIDRAIVTE